MENIEKQIKAVMLGHAVGDALGVPVEFESRDKLSKSPVTGMMGYGSYPVPAGAWSDDTSMSLAAMDVLSRGELDDFAIMTNFVKWLEDGAFTPTGKSFDVGRTCLKAIRRFIGLVDSKEADVTFYGLDGEYDNGNGSLMRIHPFSLMAWFDKRLKSNYEEIIDRASALTHAHERSKLACKIYTLILFHLLEKPRKDSIVSALDMVKNRYSDHPEYHHYERLLSVHFNKLSVEEIKSSGYVVDTLEAAVWCVLTTDSYKDCVLKAVNLGNDTDTIAAITGGLAGALYGYEAIPKEWLDTLIKRDFIEEMCERAGNSWDAN